VNQVLVNLVLENLVLGNLVLVRPNSLKTQILKL
jgi:hypothetical protein